MKKLCSLLLIVLLIFSLTIQSSFAASNRVNVDALKAIEEADDCAVRIIKKEIETGNNPLAALSGGKDYLLLTISNNTNGTVTSIDINVLAYDEKQMQVEIGKGLDLSLSLDAMQPQSFSASGISIAKGSSKTLALSCNSEDFSGVRVIIDAYTVIDPAKGTITVENPNADAWLNNAYSDRQIQIISLDDNKNYSNIKQVPGKTVNTAALIKVETQDDFSVKADAKTLKIGMGKGLLSGDDDLIITVKNNNNFAIKNITLYALAYDDTLVSKTLGAGIRPYNSTGVADTVHNIEELTTQKQYDYEDEVIINAHQTAELHLSCDASEVRGVRLIVASFENMEGRVYWNSNADEWVNEVVKTAENKYTLD